MGKKAKRVAVIGFDCAMPHLIETFIDEGIMPNFKKLRDQGVWAENCLGIYPTMTPPNWTTIATGAFPGTHQVTDYWAQTPGKTPNTLNTEEAWSSDRVKAEFIWDALDRVGKKCVVLNYPCALPSKMKNGIVVGGTGMTTGDYREGFWNLEFVERLGIDLLITNQDEYPRASQGEFTEAKGWQNLENPGEKPLELEAALTFTMSRLEPAPATWHVLAQQTAGNGYDQITLGPGKNINDAFCTLKVGEWSPKIFTTLPLKDGAEMKVFFKCKLLELTPDAEKIRLYVTSPNPMSKEYYQLICSNPELMMELEMSLSDEALTSSSGGVIAMSAGYATDDNYQTYLELSSFLDNWMAEMTEKLLQAGEWDLFYTHSHPFDFTFHININDLDPALASSKETYEKTWELHRKMHIAQDKLLGRMMAQFDDETLVIAVSDHGATPDGPVFNPYVPMTDSGLTTLKETGGKTLGQEFGKFGDFYRWFSSDPDPATSKALPSRLIYVNVNLKGRDPEGIVEPEDYHKVQHEIIDALLTYVDPETGKRPVSLAIAKSDARLLGLHGDQVGDVIYAVYPWFGIAQHGPHLQTAEWGIGKMGVLTTALGPGISENLRLERTMYLTDIVPTICYLMDWPVPADVDGSVIYQLFDDPDFKRKQIETLQN